MSLDFKLLTIESSDGADKILEMPSQPVSFPLNDDMRALAQRLKEQVVDMKGVGLAAPQINQPYSMIVIHIDEQACALRANAKPEPVQLFINPDFEGIGEPSSADWEGCFSVASQTGKIPRYERIKLSYQDEDGQKHEKEVSGFSARVLQHEIDHVKGTLITHHFKEGVPHGNPQDMAFLRLNDLNEEQLKLMRVLIEEVLSKEGADNRGYYQSLLDALNSRVSSTEQSDKPRM